MFGHNVWPFTYRDQTNEKMVEFDHYFYLPLVGLSAIAVLVRPLGPENLQRIGAARTEAQVEPDARMMLEPTGFYRNLDQLLPPFSTLTCQKLNLRTFTTIHFPL